MKQKTVLALLLVLLAGVVLFQILRPVEEVDFSRFEMNVFSQSGEDGVLTRIFETIEPTSKYAVEFGCSDGVINSNVRNPIVNWGWSGLCMDGDPKVLEKARKSYEQFPRAKIVEAWVYPGNVEILFHEHGVPLDLDFLVIDIDSNDYYVWRAITEYRPKVVIIEYNAAFAPPRKAVVRFHPLNYWDKSDYFGASIQSLYELGKQKGYELVYATSLGINLIFVDKKYYGRFGIKDNSPAHLYRPPGFGVKQNGRAPNGRGHPPWETWEQERDGIKVKPYDKDLTWDKVSISKKWVELP